MNLPLQMCAVSRGPFQKLRIVSSAGGIIPGGFFSWQFNCNKVACSCPDGTVACCSDTKDCSCVDNGQSAPAGPAGCNGPGRTHKAGNKHSKGAESSTYQGYMSCKTYNLNVHGDHTAGENDNCT
jgi:hypothetical protein